MASDLANAAVRYRNAQGVERPLALTDLGRLVLDRARKVAQRMRLAPQEVDEVAATVARRVLAVVESGAATPGSEDALVNTAARRASIDQIRRRRDRETSFEGQTSDDPTYDPPDPAVPVDERLTARELLAAIERVLPEAPPNYQRAIRGLLDGRSVPELEAEEARTTGQPPAPGLFQKHRNRAREWLTRRLLPEGDE